MLQFLCAGLVHFTNVCVPVKPALRQSTSELIMRMDMQPCTLVWFLFSIFVTYYYYYLLYADYNVRTSSYRIRRRPGCAFEAYMHPQHGCT